MAHKKQGGKTTQHKRPEGKRLGVKVSDGQRVSPGMVLVRQRGTVYHPGLGVKVGRDYTLFSASSGIVKFSRKLSKKTLSIIPN